MIDLAALRLGARIRQAFVCGRRAGALLGPCGPARTLIVAVVVMIPVFGGLSIRARLDFDITVLHGAAVLRHAD